MRSALVGAATVCRPRRRDAGHNRRARLVAPRSPAHHARPEPRTTRTSTRSGARRPGQADNGLQLAPVAESGGRAVLWQARSGGRYYVKIDNTGDGVEDVSYRWEFHNRSRNPNSCLYAVPPVNSITTRT